MSAEYIGLQTDLLRSIVDSLDDKIPPHIHKMRQQMHDLTHPISAWAHNISADQIGAIWASFEQADKSVLWTHAEHRILRQALLLVNKAAWEWLDITIPKQCSDILQLDVSKFQPVHWLDRLIVQFQRMITSDSGEKLIHPTTYIPQATIAYKFIPVKRRTSFPLATLIPQVTTHVRSAVMLWLGFSKNDGNQWKACLTRELVAAFGDDVLLLHSVWDAHNHIKPRIFGTSNIQLSIDKFTSISEALRRHRQHIDYEHPTILPNLARVGKALRDMPAQGFIPQLTPSAEARTQRGIRRSRTTEETVNTESRT